MRRVTLWLPGVTLLAGALLLTAVRQQHQPSLRAALDSALPGEVGGMAGTDAEVSEVEAQVAGFTDYALRVYGVDDTQGAASGASIYLGFYSSQTRGRTIHSPKNCLPGSGWNVLGSRAETIQLAGESITVNRYVLQQGDSRALVLYWYQGRGRVAHNEYWVKWDLLRDAATKRRTDEALVRIVVPFDRSSEEEAFGLAEQIARDLKPSVDRVLPI